MRNSLQEVIVIKIQSLIKEFLSLVKVIIQFILFILFFLRFFEVSKVI